MIVVHATFPVDQDRREDAAELFRNVAKHSRKEDGIIEYRVAADIDDQNVFRFVEQYEDEAAFGAHTETEHFAELEAALLDLLGEEPEVIRFDVENASEVEL
ncbi:putative quinol monooxygenase [Salinigranum halophilum]|uniref:putative quinol monooxygenase n=1 Tax=Salinigranum halophilum TaxID=2565931 RepID=UPI0010A92B0B|nr:putative quinol monooxygenase [Salinigranum halophilum]